MNTNKLIGSILIIIGTMIGGGMLALPMIAAEAGFPIATLLLIAMWAIMTVTALLTLEVNLAFGEYHNSLGTMAQKTLGTIGKTISWLCTLLLLYALTSAYIAANASLLATLADLTLGIKTPTYINALLFVIALGGLVFWSTKITDYGNRFFLTIKGVLLFTALILLFPQIDFVNLTRVSHDNACKYLWPMIPIFLCSFGFHPTIPSLSNYIGRKPKELKIAIICGSSITLIIYLLWMIATMGIVPWAGEHGFASVVQSNDPGQFINSVSMIANNRWVTTGINLFSNIAMTTSFLGVTLGLFDFLADGFKRPNTTAGRFQTSLLTFIPPLIFALFFPNGFIMALKYAAFFATILVVIMPVLMAYSLRKSSTLKSPYKLFGGNYLLGITAIIGFLMLGIQVLSSLKVL